MSAAQHASSPTWAEPPWSGWIETTGDALLILEAARRGLIPRVTRRLVDSERKMITSGSVFVFDEDESGIKRWTDGFFWSPSRILGNFLLYRETDKKGSNQRNGKEVEPVEFDSSKADGTLSRPKTDPGHPGVDKHRERTLVGSLTNSYKFKPDGLMKKTFSLTIGGVAQHLISYYKVEDVESGRLRPPSSLPELASLEISPEYLDKTHFRNPPKTEMGADRVLRYRGEADDIDTSASLITGPPLTGLPLLSGGREVSDNVGAKRTKRYEPYATPVPPSKRPRKSQGGNTLNSTAEPQQSQSLSDEQDGVATPIASPASPQAPQQQPQAPQVYPEPNAPATAPGVPSAPVTSYPSFGVPQYYGYVQPPHVPIYSHQAPYTTVSPPQGVPPPSAHHGQYTYVAYPPPMPNTHQSSPQAPLLAQSSPPPGSANASIISPSDPSHHAGASPSTQPLAQSQPIQPTQIPPGYYHPPTLQPAYFATPHGPPTAPHPQMYSAYPPPPPHVAPPSGAVWGPPPGHHTVPHPYGAYAAPPQQYSYGMYAAPPPQQGYQQTQPQPQQPQQYFHPQIQPQGYAHIPRPEEAQNPENGKTNGHVGRDGAGDEEAGNGE
ncbi:hypothetical protein AGABI2DRAFT_181086 [Agaricus bisporus var. bisporus H97]|uniref:hypothetical protein n=1 Tax=Agaricus bisporus var. bisporus (strain H97 / ATCC MYA-4626 / FGSC 10389) TaxID=936046 RepID=UPI00029F72CE|nr:hypothetical protein AGABI2DRAFT_181086 [Agaricus bisporus var. bisporus H97]EKV42787.1 hypothetical protein AGABI2DRAFT_181086 [Agaricus bisporus var. bisporus H97]